jgi:putative transposase
VSDRKGRRPRHGRPFLKNHAQDLAALDFFVVPTVTHKARFGLRILAHERRRVVHVNVTEHPTAAWTAQQVIDAFPWDKAPRYMLRDRDRVYGVSFRQRVRHIGIKKIVIAPRSPWQNPYVERLIENIHRECLDHIVVLHERHLKHTLASYFAYYHRFRTHLSLAMDCPEPRPVHVPDKGRVVAVHLTGPGRQQVLQGPKTALDPAATFPRSHEAWRTDAGI